MSDLIKAFFGFLLFMLIVTIIVGIMCFGFGGLIDNISKLY